MHGVPEPQTPPLGEADAAEVDEGTTAGAAEDGTTTGTMMEVVGITGATLEGVGTTAGSMLEVVGIAGASEVEEVVGTTTAEVVTGAGTETKVEEGGATKT